MNIFEQRRFVIKAIPAFFATAAFNTVLAQTEPPQDDTPPKELEPKELECWIDYWHEVENPKKFEAYTYQQITNGYFFIAMRDLKAYFYDGLQVWPKDKKPRVMTFDDGKRSQFTNAFPILRDWRLRATFFVSPDYNGDDVHPVMDNSNFKIIAEEGLELGSHTMSHADLPTFRKNDPDRWRQEIITSKQRLEDITGQEIVSFSYPYGINGIDEETKKLVSQYYKIAVVTHGKQPILKSSEIFELPRFWRS